MADLQPFEMRDFRQGRFTQASVSTALAPQNSVSFVRNVDFDTIVGSCVVRPGTTLLGSTVASGKSPLGLGTFVGKGGSPNLVLSVFPGTSNATIYYYNGTWHASTETSLSNTAKNRFAVLGGSAFICNNVNGMMDSLDGNTWGTTNSIPTYFPNLIYRYQSRFMAAGDPTYPTRVWFSSVVDPTSSPFITWNVNATTGDFIDVNPDDGGYITGFAETSTFALIFKNNAMYRFTALTNSTDPDNLFNLGAASQEAIVACQGLVYFFDAYGQGIWQTDGGYPQLISLAGVQDVIDAIPQANWSSVSAGTDGTNIYYSVGTVTLGPTTSNATTLTNCVLKFSPDNQSWAIRTYADNFTRFTLFTDTNGSYMRGADTGGKVQTINLGTTDNTASIPYEVVTQDIEFGERAHLKKVSDQFTSYNQYGQGGAMECQLDGGQVKQMGIQLNNRVNYGKDINLEAHFFNFRWYGQSSSVAPIWEGFSIEKISDIGRTRS